MNPAAFDTPYLRSVMRTQTELIDKAARAKTREEKLELWKLIVESNEIVKEEMKARYE